MIKVKNLENINVVERASVLQGNMRGIELRQYSLEQMTEILNEKIKNLKMLMNDFEPKTLKEEAFLNEVKEVTTFLEDKSFSSEYLKDIIIMNDIQRELDKDYDLDGKNNREELFNGTDPTYYDKEKIKEEI